MKRSLIIWMLVLCGVSACEHDNFENLIGPSIDCSLYEDLVVEMPLMVSETSVDLSVGPMTFTAAFSDEVVWTISIVGNTSGAEKTLSGRGTIVEVTWDGSTDNVTFFRAEICTVTMTVDCVDERFEELVEITATKTNAGFLFSDFDEEGVPAPSWWSTYKLPLEEKLAFGRDSTGGAAQGTYYLKYSGQDVDGDGYLAIAGHNGSWVTGITAGNDDTYVNALVRATSTTDVELRVVENDGDEWSFRTLVDWEGWQLVSFPYSQTELKTAGSGDSGSVKNSNRISRMKIGLRASPANSAAELDIDYIILTEGAPLIP